MERLSVIVAEIVAVECRSASAKLLGWVLDIVAEIVGL